MPKIAPRQVSTLTGFWCGRRTLRLRAAHGSLHTAQNFMNIGITVYPSYGGSGIVGSELGKELAARGHTVHFIASCFAYAAD
jgi:hypothetical protein